MTHVLPSSTNRFPDASLMSSKLNRVLVIFAYALVSLLYWLPGNAAATPTTAETTEVVSVSSAQAIDRALAGHPTLRAGDADIDAMKARLLAAWGVYVPKIDFTTLFTVMPAVRGDPFNGFTDYDDWGPFVRVDVAADSPIYAFGQLEALRDAARAGIDLSRAKRAIAQAELVYQVRRAYCDLQLAEEVKAVLLDGKKYLERARKRLETMEEEDDPQYDQIEMLKLRVFEADVQERVFSVERDLSRAEHMLRQSMGLGVDVAVRITERDLSPYAFVVAESAQYMALALQSRPEIAALNAKDAVAQSEVDLQLARFFPTLKVIGNYRLAYSPVADDQLSPFASDSYNVHTVGVSLGLSWTFDLGQQLGRYHEALAKQEKAHQDREAEILKLQMDIENATADVKIQAQLIEIQASALRAARGWLIAKSDLYDTGFATLDDVQDALVEYYKRKIGHYQAISTFNLAVLKLSRVVGADVTEYVPGTTGGAPSQNRMDSPKIESR
ncbi:MAG: TolC family protein [Myxococcales bacterium]|nr:TolC family protein [Myxococcales bacterium]